MSIVLRVQEYNSNAKIMKDLKKRQDELAKLIKDHASSNGVKDSKGSSYCDDEKFLYGSQAKKSIKLNQDKAKSFFLQRGLYQEVVKVQETVDEDKIEQLIANGTIAPEDIEDLVDVKVTYSVVVKEKEVQEEIPEVEVLHSVKKPVKKFSKKK